MKDLTSSLTSSLQRRIRRRRPIHCLPTRRLHPSPLLRPTPLFESSHSIVGNALCSAIRGYARFVPLKNLPGRGGRLNGYADQSFLFGRDPD